MTLSLLCDLIIIMRPYLYYSILARATLMFHVELLDLQKPSIMGNIPSGGSSFTLIGVVVILGFVGYELYKRANTQSDAGKKVKSGGKRKRR